MHPQRHGGALPGPGQAQAGRAVRGELPLQRRIHRHRVRLHLPALPRQAALPGLHRQRRGGGHRLLPGLRRRTATSSPSPAIPRWAMWPWAWSCPSGRGTAWASTRPCPSVRSSVGKFDKNSVYDVGRHPGFVEHKKWQFHTDRLLYLLPQRPPGRAGHRPGRHRRLHPGRGCRGPLPGPGPQRQHSPYFLPNYGIPNRTSWGYVAEIGINYPNVAGSGITLTPQIDFAHDVKGTAPNALPFVEGRKARDPVDSSPTTATAGKAPCSTPTSPVAATTT
jgi:hypothetical protein